MFKKSPPTLFETTKRLKDKPETGSSTGDLIFLQDRSTAIHSLPHTGTLSPLYQKGKPNDSDTKVNLQ